MVDWLINYISEPIRKSVSGFKGKIASLFKTNTPKKTVYGRGKKPSKPRKHEKVFYIRREQKIIEDRIIRDIRTLFETEEEKRRKKGMGENEKPKLKVN